MSPRDLGAVSPSSDIRRGRVYQLPTGGFWHRFHRLSGLPFLAIYLLLPWIPVRGHPAVHIDLPERHLWVLGHLFTPGDGFLLVFILLGAAFGLFFVTALLGRVWCGFACPQTVLLEEVVRRFERLVEGPRPVHMRRDAGPWTFDKAWRKAVKWTGILLFSLLVAGTFISYFTTPAVLWTGRAGGFATGATGVLTGLLFFDLVWFRERFCIFICPYARFQGALTDADTVAVGYDRARGEPRAPGRHRPEGAGACVDCGRCVTVCPQGIDIRNGFQLECISCGLCIDACEPVMQRFGQPNLIRWETVDGRAKPRWTRPRILAYVAILTVIFTGFVWRLATRHIVDVEFNRLPGTLYVVDDDGSVRNTFLLALTNKDAEPLTPRITVEGLPDARVVVPEATLQPGEVRKLPVSVEVPPGAGLGRTTPMKLVVDVGEDRVVVDTTFKSGAPVTSAPGDSEG